MVPFALIPAARHRGRIDAAGGGRWRRGFTLVELLVVLAVTALLAALLFPLLVRAREQAYRTTCLSNLHQIAAAHLLYLQDWDERFPAWREEGPPQVESLRAKPSRADAYWTELLQPYLRDPAVFRDPGFSASSVPGPGVKLADYALLTWGPDGEGTAESPYWRWPGPALTLSQVCRPAETFSVMDGYTTTERTEGWHLVRHGQGMNAVFADGHTRWLLPNEVQRLDTDGHGFYWWHYAAADR
jgi:prepilin-type N-terminal cleavage/methylation domain-containing protein/prepilin-type processing-associated H-X9-DG protein